MSDDLAIPASLDRRPIVGSYTFLQCYDDICPHQAFRRYIAKDIPFTSTPAMDWGNKVHTAMELRVGGGKPLPTDMAHWEPFAVPFDGKGAKTEMKAGLTASASPCDFFAKDVKYRCKIDLHVMNGEKAYLADWKTGNSKFESPFELEIQALHLHAQHPHLKQIVGNYVWLKENRLGKTYDLSDTTATWRKCTTIMERIETNRKQGHFEKRPGPLCGWCAVKDCEHNKNVAT